MVISYFKNRNTGDTIKITGDPRETDTLTATLYRKGETVGTWETVYTGKTPPESTDTLQAVLLVGVDPSEWVVPENFFIGYEYENGRPCIEYGNVNDADDDTKRFICTVQAQEDENAPDCDLDDFGEHAGVEDCTKLTLLDEFSPALEQIGEGIVWEVLGIVHADPWANGGDKYKVAKCLIGCDDIVYI